MKKTNTFNNNYLLQKEKQLKNLLFKFDYSQNIEKYFTIMTELNLIQQELQSNKKQQTFYY